MGSDSVSTTSGGCIASGEELYQAFLRRGVTPSGNFHFDAHFPNQQHYMRYATFTVVYNTTTLTENANANVSTVHTLPDLSSNRCCDPSNEGCFIVQTTSRTVYRFLPSPLVFMLSAPLLSPFSPTYNGKMPGFASRNIFIGCWSTPPFCKCHQNRDSMLNDFTLILVCFMDTLIVCACVCMCVCVHKCVCECV